MNTRQFAQVGIGFIGVWSLVIAADLFSNVMIAERGGIERAAIIPIGLPLVVLLGLSYVLVFHGGSLAAAIAPDASGANATSGTDLARVLLPVVGVLLLGGGIPAFANTALNFIFSGSFDGQPAAAPMLIRMISTGIQIVFAIYIIARPERLLGFLQRRTAGGPAT